MSINAAAEGEMHVGKNKKFFKDYWEASIFTNR